jgi:CRISPR-associated protein Cas1
MILTVTEQGSRIGRSGNMLHISKGDRKLLMYPLEAIEQMVIMGRVEISTAMLGLLMQRGIDTIFLTADGRYKGKIVGTAGKNIFLREAQYLRRREAAFVLQFGKSLVAAKLRNSRNMVRRQHRAVYQALQDRWKNALSGIRAAADIHVLRGFEGSFAALYFQHFPQLLNNDYGFRKRIKHPPPDPVNILLSFGYTLLFNTIYGLVEIAGLDAFAGFYHQSSYGHPALVSDLMEPYRAPLVDALVVRLINSEAITPAHFEKIDDKLRLQPEAVKAVVSAYNQRLQSRYSYNDRNETVYSILQKDVQKFGAYLQGESEAYEPFIFR